MRKHTHSLLRNQESYINKFKYCTIIMFLIAFLIIISREVKIQQMTSDDDDSCLRLSLCEISGKKIRRIEVQYRPVTLIDIYYFLVAIRLRGEKMPDFSSFYRVLITLIRFAPFQRSWILTKFLHWSGFICFLIKNIMQIF